MKQIYISLLFLSICGSALAQIKSVVTGKVVDVNNRPIPSANIKIIETNQYGTTTEDGTFKFNLSNLTNTTLTFEFSFISYQRLTKDIKIFAGDVNVGNIVLKELNLSLETIDINAKRNYEGQSNSSLIMSRDVIEQTPALSISDLLNQIPNRKIVAPSLQRVQTINLRSSFEPTTDQRGQFELSNAFGVAIIVDGNAISNNMNMQSYNPGMLGAGNSLLSSEGYGLNGSRGTAYSGDYAFGGTDLRQVPVDNIESIEVISGVAPAKYGDLSDGAVIVERQAGKAPGYLRMQLRNDATSYGYSQGFKISPKAGAINVGLNYVNSYADNRDRLKAYKRINSNLMYSNTFGREARLKNTLSLDYGKNLDGVKSDPDDIKKALMRFDSWNFSVSNRSSYRVNHNFLKNISINLRYSEGHQVTYKEEFKNEPYVIISDATSTGIFEGAYVRGIYTAQTLIDGRPVNASAKLDLNADFRTRSVTHFLNFGASYDYGANNGLGQVLDPNRPRFGTAITTTSLSPSRSERYYDFNLAVPQNNIGLYAEDMFKLPLFKKELNVRAGLRYDLQNALPSFSPRLNLNYALSKSVKIGLAYGLSFKSPALAQRFPGPTYYEIPLVNSYNNSSALESTYLVYVNRYDHHSENLKSAYSQTIELSSQVKIKDFNLSLSLFSKLSRNGIGTIATPVIVTLPTYNVVPQPGQKPLITTNGTKNYYFVYHRFDNDLSSDNQGLELILNTPQIKAISTSFNISGGIFRTNYQTNSPRLGNTSDQTITRDDYAKVGFYEPLKRISYLSNGRISSATHIPKISLVISFIADFSIAQKSIESPNSGIPFAYITNNGKYVTITNFDASNPDYGQLFKPLSEVNKDNMPKIVPNFHLSLSKEIKKRLRFSFNVFNVFNYQPYYISSSGTYTYPNSAPSFGAEISLKL
ncbi:TonB-dependent receptor [Pedobacter sp. KBS0701]|uniref:TonB-dependent receptor domain-containing protein n=1 Tax=Pedobacter sp. KBS0701 TaxID=2578106 RepID=UPI00110D717C|nr:TonB-dependent receptor [Pedobacter sp. KBS0701]QDW26124.1 TonB-dependent receptor [Pedobacter sp. KBS0701]